MEPLRGTTDMREHKFGSLHYPDGTFRREISLRLASTVPQAETPKGNQIIQESLYNVNKLSGG